MAPLPMSPFHVFAAAHRVAPVRSAYYDVPDRWVVLHLSCDNPTVNLSIVRDGRVLPVSPGVPVNLDPGARFAVCAAGYVSATFEVRGEITP